MGSEAYRYLARTEQSSENIDVGERSNHVISKVDYLIPEMTRDLALSKIGIP